MPSRRPYRGWTLWVAAAALLCTTSARADPEVQSAPSVVFVLIDDLGWTGLSVTMDEKVPQARSDLHETPRIAELADEGMRFSHAYAPSAMCTPSRASLLTGRSPAALHMTTPGPARRRTDRKVIPPLHVTDLPEGETTLAEALKSKGYATAHLGKWHLAGGGPGRHGFDVHDGATGNGGPGENADPDPKDMFGVTRRSIAFMVEQVAAGRPFYLQLSHYALHAPTRALTETEEAFQKVPLGQRHRDRALAAMLKDLDTSIGMLLKSIDALGIRDNTYVILMSDNGGGGRRSLTANAPLSGMKAMLLEGGIRVPLIVRGPNVEAGSSCARNVTGWDLFPTVCALAGVDSLPSAVEGVSLVPLLRGTTERFERPPDELMFHFPHYGRGPSQVPQSAILAGDLKLIRWWESGETKLFDLAKDIGESIDLSDARPEDAQALEARLDAWLEAVGAQVPVANPDYDPSAEPRRGPRGRGGRGRPER